MMKKIIFSFVMFLFCISLFSQNIINLKGGKKIVINKNGTVKLKQESTTNKYKQESTANNTFTDPRDGHIYKTVKIGNQTWMAENLAYKASSGCWAYNNDQTNVKTYGYLYNWETAIKVCPVGWHLPSDAEWTTLTNFLGGESVAGGKLKEAGELHWFNPNSHATNESGFTALPGGLRDVDGSLYYIRSNSYWWSSTEKDTKLGWSCYIVYNNCIITRYFFNKLMGQSVRCIKNSDNNTGNNINSNQNPTTTDTKILTLMSPNLEFGDLLHLTFKDFTTHKESEYEWYGTIPSIDEIMNKCAYNERCLSLEGQVYSATLKLKLLDAVEYNSETGGLEPTGKKEKRWVIVELQKIKK